MKACAGNASALAHDLRSFRNERGFLGEITLDLAVKWWANVGEDGFFERGGVWGLESLMHGLGNRRSAWSAPAAWGTLAALLSERCGSCRCLR